MRKLVLLAGVAALTLSGAVAFAQGATKANPAAGVAPRTAASLECSRQADTKGLHGKARHAFRSKCKRDMAK
jgi:psiF repeat